MTFPRRKFLSLLGGGVVLAAVPVGHAVTRTPQTALQPWQRAGRYDDPREKALSFALLAPNPHNRQPWIADLGREGEVTLLADPARLLPQTDPFDRQITIGMGCFLELMRMAAAEDGFTLGIDLFPEGTDSAALGNRPVARCRFVRDPAAVPDQLFAHVLARRSLKEPFDTTRPVPDSALAALADVVRHSRYAATNAPSEVEHLRTLSSEAIRIEVETPHTFQESVDLFRIGHREVDANPDGLDFTGPMMETLRLTGLFTRAAAADPRSTAFRTGLDIVLAQTGTAMAHMWLATPGNSRAEQIGAGMDWVRINLAATGMGLGIQPLSQFLQEYSEVAGLYNDIHQRLAQDGERLQMFARLGYGPQVPASPRWPLETRIARS
jgi:hypothetical protein